MTCEDLYKPSISQYIKAYAEAYQQFTVHSLEGMSIQQLIAERDSLEKQLAAIKANPPVPFEFDLGRAAQEYFAPRAQEFQTRLEQIERDFTDKKEQLDYEHEQAILLADEKANAAIRPIKEKHARLQDYKTRLLAVLEEYNISPLDVQVSQDITAAEYEALLDSSLEVCEKLTKQRDFSVIKKIYEPTENTDRTNLLICLVAGIFCLAPAALFALYGYMYVNTFRMYKNVDKFRVAQSLMYDTNFDKFLVDNPREEVPDVDYGDIEEEKQTAMLAAMEQDPQIEFSKFQQEIAANLMKIKEDFANAHNTVITLHKRTMSVLEDAYAAAKEAVDSYIEQVVPFGSQVSPLSYMSDEFVLGQDPGPLDAKYKFEFQSYVFNSRAPRMQEFVQLLLCNALLAVKEKHLYVTIYDPMQLGSQYSDFFRTETAEYIDVKTGEHDKMIKELREYVQASVKILNNKHINTFNKEAEAVKKVTRDYKLVIVASGAEEIMKNKQFMEMAAYSGQYGVAVWFMSETPATTQCPFYRSAFMGVENPYPINSEVIIKVMNTYVDAYMNSKADSVDYKAGFADRYIPKEEWWTHSTNKGIDLNFGLANGDPTKGYAIQLGDANVHAMMVGATGAGKSAAINQMLATLLTKYSPNELELVMVDFKNVEFAAFTDPTTGRCFIPHARIIAGTKDGEYAISVFDYLQKEMDRRTKIFAEAGVEKLEKYNNLVRKNGHPELAMPRILVLIDEFQVMFTEVDPKSVDTIKKAIVSLSKLARFCGCHMWFTSQSMAGTMGKDIQDQFSLRAALRCSKDVSSSIIGAGVAATIKTKFGYLYTNTDAGEKQDSTTLWRIPYFDKDDAVNLFKELGERAKTEGLTHHNAFFYDETRLHPHQEMLDVYGKNLDFPDQPRLFFLGERTGFSTNRAPINVVLQTTDGENVFSVAFENKDLLNMAMSFIDNINKKPSAKLLISCADNDTSELLELDTLLPESLYELSKANFPLSDLFDSLEGLIGARKGKAVTELTPVYVMCIQWEKMVGIGREENYKLAERWKKILQEGPNADVHFIFVSKTTRDIPTYVLNNCNHKIAAKCADFDSTKLLDSSRAEKLPGTDFAIYRYGTNTQKFKIYQHTFSRTLAAREITL